jgi:hypothetical protein
VPHLVLCDFAEVINGKLYMQGAGWSRVVANQPFTIAVALFWRIPWGQANHKQEIAIRLVTEDGDPYLDAAENPVRADGEIEVGRPAGIKDGSSLDAPLAVRFGPMIFPPGGYRFELEVDGTLAAFASFEAVASP